MCKLSRNRFRLEIDIVGDPSGGSITLKALLHVAFIVA